ncbi:MAG: carcinine hydrolase/isopenicillin-N N-acyltransferase family protein [Aristaeellaceae bacterium]
MKKCKKILLGLLVGLLAVVLVLALTIGVMWRDEIATVMSMQQLRQRDDDHRDGSVYTLHVKGGFYLDDLVAQGGVSSDAELIDFVTKKITRGLIDISISNPAIGCSSFTARTVDGDSLFARNYDFSKTNTCIVLTEANEGRHASISTVDLQFLGLNVDKDVEGLMKRIICLAAPYAPLDGINDAGVSCGIYMTYQGGEKTIATNQQTDKPDFTSSLLLRLILDYADDLEEAVAIASAYDLHDSAGTSYHYMVADATGRSAVLEWVGDNDATDNDGSQRELIVTYNDADEHIGAMEAVADYQVVTNFILQPGYYDGCPEGSKRGYDRYERLYQELNAVDGVVADEAQAMAILSVVGRRGWTNDDSNSCTIHSVIYNLTDRTAMWIPNEHYGEADAVYTFALNSGN